MKGRENKPHIGIFGRCNTGKSTLLNFLCGEGVAIVSPEAGTTADPVRRSYEIRGFAPVIFIDTAGLDDTPSGLGGMRSLKSLSVLGEIDLAIIVFREWGKEEAELARRLEEEDIPFITLFNSFDGEALEGPRTADISIDLANAAGTDRDAILDAIKRALPENSYTPVSMFGARVGKGDTVLLICPIDSEAPTGRLILPQVQAIRELLDKGAVAIVLQPEEVGGFLASHPLPKLAVTDSQMFGAIEPLIPGGVELTSFSILLAAAKGDYGTYLRGLEAVDRLKQGDKILIVENCSHQSSCDDIGRHKIPAWLDAYTGCKLDYTFAGGRAPMPENLGDYALIVQCGGCMVTRRQLLNRIRQTSRHGVPMTNYGMLIRKIRG